MITVEVEEKGFTDNEESIELYTKEQWLELYEKRKLRVSRIKRMQQVYFIRQKLYGVLMVLFGVLISITGKISNVEELATVSFFVYVFGIYVMFTRHKVLE